MVGQCQEIRFARVDKHDIYIISKYCPKSCALAFYIYIKGCRADIVGIIIYGYICTYILMILVFTGIVDGDSCIGYMQYPTMASLDFLELCHVKPNWPDCVIPDARNSKR